MADVNIPVQQTSLGTPATNISLTTFANSGDTLKWTNDGKKTHLLVVYEGVGTITLTLNITQKVVGQTVNPKVITLTGSASERMCMLPVLDAGVFNDGDNKVSCVIAWTGGTPVVKVAAVQVA